MRPPLLFDTFVRFIRAALRTLLVVGLVVAAAAFLTGPSTTATSIRKAIEIGNGRGSGNVASTQV